MRNVPFPIECGDTTCPLYAGRACVPAELSCQYEDDECDVLFIGEAPTETDASKRRPFVGKEGWLLRKAIREAKPGPVNFGFSNVIRCLPGGEIGRPEPAAIRACKHFVMRDIERFDPDVLCLLGPAAVNLLLPDRPPVHSERGRWRWMNIAGRDRIVMVTYAPGHVYNQLGTLPMWYADMQFCMRLAAGWRPQTEWGQTGRSRCLKTIDEVADLVETLLSLDRSHYVALDVETRNLNKRYGNRLGMLQFCWDGVESHCVPLDHPKTPFDVTELQVVRKLLRRLFTRKPSFRGWITHFGKFEQTQIGQHVLDRDDGVARTFHNAPMFDTGAFAYLLNENATAGRGTGYTLKFLARQYLGFFHYDDATLMARAEGSLLDLPLDCDVPIGQPGWQPNLTDYGGMDAYVTWRLFWALQAEAAVQRYRGKALKLLEHLFGPTFRLLSQIERNGFWGNLAHLKMLQDPARSPIVGRLIEIDKKELPAIPSAQRANEKVVLRKSYNTPPVFDMPWILDLNKNDHVRTWLVEELELEPLEVGKTGAASVGKAFFQHYRDVDEVALVEERRGLAKLQSAYIKQLIEFIDPRHAPEDCQDGRVRCDLFFTSTVSGRGSASNPNMQQQVRGDSPAKAAIKNIWQAEQPGVQRSFKVDFAKGLPSLDARAPSRPSNCLVQLDFVTAEVKWWALLSGCPKLSEALLKGYRMRQQYRADPRPELKEAAAIEGDLHKNTAAMMFGAPVREVDKQMRTAAKSIVFGAMYGRGVRALAAQIKKTEEEAAELLEKFSGAFPVGWDWLQRCPTWAGERWYIESPIGRRRRLPGYLLESNSKTYDEKRVVAECDRMAKNSPIQGISSDAAFLGATLFAQHVEQNRLSWKVQNVVHDSCVYQVPIDELRESVTVAEHCFTTATMQRMTDVWGMEFTCPIEIDFEFGLTWGGLSKWDFTDAEFDRIKTEMLSQTI